MRQYLPLAGVCLAVFLAMTGMGMAGVALPEKYLQAAGTMRSAGWLASMFALSYMCCQYPAGWFADRYGYRHILGLGFFLMALSAAVFDRTHTVWGIYLGRLLQGAGEAPVWALAPAYLGRTYSGMRGKAIGWYNAAFHVGMMTGPFIVSQGGAGGSTSFRLFAWCSLAAVVLVLASVRQGARTLAEPSGPLAGVPAEGGLWPLAFGVPLFGAVYGLATSSMPVYLAAAAGFSREGIGWFYFCLFLGISLAQYGAGSLSDRYGRTPFVSCGLLGAGLGLSGFFAPSQTVVLGSVVVMGAGLGAFAVSSLALVNERAFEGRQGRASAYYYLAWGAGYCVGPLASNGMGLRPLSMLLVLGSVLGGVLQLRLKKSRIPRSPFGAS